MSDDFTAEDLGDTTTEGLNLEINETSDEDATLGLNLDLTETESDQPEDELNLDLSGEESSSPEADLAAQLFGDMAGEEESTADVAHNLFADDEEEQADEAPSAEFDEAVEKAMADLHSELVVKEGDWYVVHTYSGMENRVKQNIESRVKSLNMEDYIFETIVPTEEVIEMQRSGQKKKVTRVVIPGYVLVRMDMNGDSWSTIRHTPSVTGFVGHDANAPVPLSLNEVEGMLRPSVIAQVTASQTVKPARKRKVEVVDFKVGDNVTVIDGPFAGVAATITEINTNSSRVRALVEILGRETPVDLEFGQVAKEL